MGSQKPGTLEAHQLRGKRAPNLKPKCLHKKKLSEFVLFLIARNQDDQSVHSDPIFEQDHKLGTYYNWEYLKAYHALLFSAEKFYFFILMEQ